jgi:membrane protein YdbS with pleckstrin-like domain
MITYWILPVLPEWRRLGKAQRLSVWRQFVHPMLMRWPLWIAKCGVLLLGVLAAQRLGLFDQTTPLVVVLVFTFLFMDVVDLFVIMRHRHQLDSYIQSHGAETQSAG